MLKNERYLLFVKVKQRTKLQDIMKSSNGFIRKASEDSEDLNMQKGNSNPTQHPSSHNLHVSHFKSTQ